MTIKKTIIFLDIDGVLNPLFFEKTIKQLSSISNGELSSGDNFGQYFHPACVGNINLLIKKTNAKIVITSTWKNSMNLEDFKELWKSRGYGDPDVITGVTPTLEDPNKRGLEIEQYIKSTNMVDQYVIIDDMGEGFFEEHQVDRLVKCNPDFGFTKSNLEEAINILNR